MRPTATRIQRRSNTNQRRRDQPADDRQTHHHPYNRYPKTTPFHTPARHSQGSGRSCGTGRRCRHDAGLSAGAEDPVRRSSARLWRCRGGNHCGLPSRCDAWSKCRAQRNHYAACVQSLLARSSEVFEGSITEPDYPTLLRPPDCCTVSMRRWTTAHGRPRLLRRAFQARRGLGRCGRPGLRTGAQFGYGCL